MNRKKKRARDARYRAAHRAELAARSAAYYASHREERCEYMNGYYGDHREERLDAMAAWYAEHREAAAAGSAAYYAAHREERAAYGAGYYAGHREESAARGAAWAAANPDKCRAMRRVSKAKRRGARLCEHLACLVVGAAQLAWQVNEHVCYLCGVPVIPGGNLDMDHVIPIAPPHNGLHCADNLRPACAHCNRSKGAKLLEKA